MLSLSRFRYFDLKHLLLMWLLALPFSLPAPPVFLSLPPFGLVVCVHCACATDVPARLKQS